MTTPAARLLIPEASADIHVLTPADVRSLRLLWDGRFTPREIEQHVSREPNLSVWNTRTGEYLIGGPWRHRREIGSVLELGGTGCAIQLLQGFAALAAVQGQRMVIASEQAERRKREFYDVSGFQLVEEIVIYEIPRVRADTPRLAGLRFERVDLSDRTNLAELLQLDHQSFPWLWWNSEDEFREYCAAPGVAIDAGRDPQGRMIAYVGMTRYRSWGHLDRIAIAPDLQGRGYGRAALDYAVMTLAAAGARRVGLSTQMANTRSRALYESYGFRRMTAHDYRLYGRRLDGSSDPAARAN